jgi:uncharacterized protein YjbI with pentapeptide repeats
MEKHDKRRLIQNSRRKLMARWYDEQGQNKRAELIAALHEYKSLPDTIITSFMSEHGSSPRLDLRCINLSGQVLDGVDLGGANLQGANLARCSLKQAKLVEADLRDTFLRHTDLTDADLRGANLDGAVMEDTIFHGATLDGAYVTSSTIVAGATELPSSVRRLGSSRWFADSLTNPGNRGEEE